MRRSPKALIWGVLLVVALLFVLVGTLTQNVTATTTVEIIVPAGTQAQLDRGEIVALMPARLELKVGDHLRIDNQDAFDHLVGPYFVAAGEVLDMSYGAPGEFQGMCALSAGNRFVLVITE